jgi:hypothetical protein
LEKREEHAQSFAIAQPSRRSRQMGNGAVLPDAYRVIARSSDERRAITPAAELLVDNHYLVELTMRTRHGL